MQTPSRSAQSFKSLTRPSHWACILSAADTTTEKSLSTSVALYDAQPQRRRYVFAERCVSLCLTATPPTLEGQPNLLLDEVADVTTVVKVTTAQAFPSTCRREVVVDRCIVDVLSTQKTGVVVLSLTFVARGDDQSSRLCRSSRREGVSFRSYLEF